MIDTIRLQVSLHISPTLRDDLEAFQAGTSAPRNHPEWAITDTRSESAKGWRSGSIRLTHVTLGIKCWIDDGRITTVEVSLPRLIFGCNGTRLRNDTHLAQAREALWELLDTITIPGSRQATLSRLDLVQHLPYSPARLLPVLRHARSPFVRRSTVSYNSTSVVFPGANIRVSAYDKLVEMGLGPGTFTRLEVQLRNSETIKKHIGHRHLQDLTFAECYAAYRAIVLAFQLPSEPAEAYSEALLLALCSHHQFSPCGIPVIDWALQAAPKKKRKQLETAVARHLSGLTKIDLAACLPEAGPPDDMPDADQSCLAPAQTGFRDPAASTPEPNRISPSDPQQ